MFNVRSLMFNGTFFSSAHRYRAWHRWTGAAGGCGAGGCGAERQQSENDSFRRRGMADAPA